MSPDGRRTLRISEALRSEFGMLLLRDVKDPRLAGLTIAHVEVSADLRRAVVFFSTLRPASDEPEIVCGLQSARGFLRSAATRSLGLRVSPELEFRRAPSEIPDGSEGR